MAEQVLHEVAGGAPACGAYLWRVMDAHTCCCTGSSAYHHTVAKAMLVLDMLNQAPHVIRFGIMTIWASKFGIIERCIPFV